MQLASIAMSPTVITSMESVPNPIVISSPVQRDTERYRERERRSVFMYVRNSTQVTLETTITKKVHFLVVV
jgi:hypothetical protein